jgi:group II intron reverse transcriptase/maturase
VKAKAEPDYRFYALYDKLYRTDVLAIAYSRCRANKGAPGVDGQSFEQVEQYGREQWIGELAKSIRTGLYRPQAIRRVYIVKPNGKLIVAEQLRPLGIPTLQDRVLMMAAVMVLNPIFEADLMPQQYAYREGRNAHDALTSVRQNLNTGLVDVVDADLSDYFGTIPHSALMRSVARRIVDKKMLNLIKSWLGIAVEETDARGHKSRTTESRDTGIGIPQGGLD